jgi:hypothetical protein
MAYEDNSPTLDSSHRSGNIVYPDMFVAQR